MRSVKEGDVVTGESFGGKAEVLGEFVSSYTVRYGKKAWVIKRYSDGGMDACWDRELTIVSEDEEEEDESKSGIREGDPV